MRAPKTFRRGGLPVRLEREWPLELPIRNAFLPVSALVLLKQHAGPAARCLVSRGDAIREGMVIGKAEGPGQAAIHAPVPGIVSDVRSLRLPAGGECLAVVLALEGSFDRLGKKAEKFLWSSMSRNDMLQTLRDKGVVEGDLPGRPLFELLPEAKAAKLLVLNAIESEPWLRSESAALEARTEEILDGLRIVAKVVEPERVVIALDEAEAELAAKVEALAARGDKPIECVRFRSRYPQDLPKRLLESLVPQRRGGSQTSALFVRPATALAVSEAIIAAKPFVERYVTVAGGAVKRPSVLKARIGTSIGDLFEECGGFIGNPERIILGGPFRGLPVYDLDMPISKTTSAILALSREETRRGQTLPCIRCGRCAELCPDGLDPEAMYRRIERGRLEEARDLGLGDCSLCGLCGYACPSRLPLVESFAAYARLEELRQ